MKLVVFLVAFLFGVSLAAPLLAVREAESELCDSPKWSRTCTWRAKRLGALLVRNPEPEPEPECAAFFGDPTACMIKVKREAMPKCNPFPGEPMSCYIKARSPVPAPEALPLPDPQPKCTPFPGEPMSCYMKREAEPQCDGEACFVKVKRYADPEPEPEPLPLPE